ncbi:coiled-coil domain-containing protein 81-like isoform X1 [Clinocottus analis]|uniref:coiled-coil domain-containing protein 81-like isoform X1 n=1 Tax=Clinocottus analis TaxID=304258 RepID=UPI0035C09FBE
MTDILRLLSGADGGTVPPLPRLSGDDIQSIWAAVSAFIERQMTLQKGVRVAGLGTFTFSQQKLDIGNKYTMIQRPIFLIAGKLVQSLGLKQVRPLAAATHLPVVQLNLAAVSQQTAFSRDEVERCVRETLLLLLRALASEQNAFLTFQGIGVLSFRSNKVQMKFSRAFVQAMDGTGRLLSAFNHRPGSSSSLLSGLQTANPVTMPTACSPQPAARRWSAAPDPKNAGDVQQREPKSLQPASMKAVSLFEELSPKPPEEAADKLTSSVAPAEVSLKLQEPHVTVSCSGHARAGQERCYLCMQRAQRNVPVYLREQQQAEQRAQEKLLLLQEQHRDQQLMHQEQEKLNEQRTHAKQVAAFNLRTLEEKQKTCCALFPTSFVFPARPLTPARSVQQHRYRSELQSQMEARRQHEARDQHSRLLLERLDQVQLVQEAALQKAQQLQQKHQRTALYRRALDTQVGDKKSSDPPECQVDKSGFNRPAADHAEGRERAQKLFRVNLSAATQRKKEELHSRRAELEKEREDLRQDNMAFMTGRINRFEKRRDLSKSLEDEWRRSAKQKQQREEEERRFLRSAGELLVDKLAQYRHCCQCKRRTSNCGESNIWKDSQYLSGSQFMI